MAAGLQGHIQRGARRGFLAVGQSLPLGVEPAPGPVPALAQQLPILDDHRPHQGVRVGFPRPSLCQGKGLRHPLFILIHSHAFFPGRAKQKRPDRYFTVQGAHKVGRNFPPLCTASKKPRNEKSFQGILHAKEAQKHCARSSSSIQTILSASEFHRILPYGSRAVPPVGIFTLP